MKLEPLGDRVIFEDVGESKVTRGGILIPDAARKNKAVSYGRVIGVGPGRANAEGRLVPLAVKVGDTVMYPRQAPAVLPLVDEQGNEKDVLLCRENEIIGIVTDLPQVTHVAGLDGALLSITPHSLARPDSAYKNIDEINRAVSDLRESGAPPEVIAEVNAEHQDEE